MRLTGLIWVRVLCASSPMLHTYHSSSNLLRWCIIEYERVCRQSPLWRQVGFRGLYIAGSRMQSSRTYFWVSLRNTPTLGRYVKGTLQDLDILIQQYRRLDPRYITLTTGDRQRLITALYAGGTSSWFRTVTDGLSGNPSCWTGRCSAVDTCGLPLDDVDASACELWLDRRAGAISRPTDQYNPGNCS